MVQLSTLFKFIVNSDTVFRFKTRLLQKQSLYFYYPCKKFGRNFESLFDSVNTSNACFVFPTFLCFETTEPQRRPRPKSRTRFAFLTRCKNHAKVGDISESLSPFRLKTTRMIDYSRGAAWLSVRLQVGCQKSTATFCKDVYGSRTCWGIVAPVRRVWTIGEHCTQLFQGYRVTGGVLLADPDSHGREPLRKI